MTSTGLSLFSQDQISNKHDTRYYVTDLDDSMSSGTHWVVMNIRRDIIEYFASFGLNCLKEVIRVSSRLNLNYVNNSTPYQDLFSELCGYYCLHYMNERSRKKTHQNIIKVFFHTEYAYKVKLI